MTGERLPANLSLASIDRTVERALRALESAADDITQLRTERAELLLALKSLRNEVAGTFAIAEASLRFTIGNTNVACILNQLDEAKAVMDKIEARL